MHVASKILESYTMPGVAAEREDDPTACGFGGRPLEICLEPGGGDDTGCQGPNFGALGGSWRAYRVF